MQQPSLDIEQPDALLAYLRSRSRIGADESPTVTVLKGGVSNRTVLVERACGESWVLKQALPKLRTQADWYSDPSRIEREAAGIQWLSKVAPAGSITPLCFTDFQHHLLCMQAVPHPHENWKSMLLAGRLEPGHVEQFAALLGAIHRRAAESIDPLRNIFDDRTFFESLRLEPYYAYAARQVPAARQFLHDLIDDTRRRRLTIVHGDYSPKNVLVRGDGRIVLLDHEVIHWGDPAFDLGFALTHLLSKAHHRRDVQFVEAAMRFCRTYAEVVGTVYWDDNSQAMAARHTLGCMLARVAGRSPLEYLDEAERARQRDWVVAGIKEPAVAVMDLLRLFSWTMELHAGH